MRIRPVGAKLFEADGWTDRHDEANSSFHDSANMPQKEQQANGENRLINKEQNSPKRSTSKNLNYWTSTFVAVWGSSNLTSMREEGAVMMQTHPGGHADIHCSFENIKCYHNYEPPSYWNWTASEQQKWNSRWKWCYGDWSYQETTESKLNQNCEYTSQYQVSHSY